MTPVDFDVIQLRVVLADDVDREGNIDRTDLDIARRPVVDPRRPIERAELPHFDAVAAIGHPTLARDVRTTRHPKVEVFATRNLNESTQRPGKY